MFKLLDFRLLSPPAVISTFWECRVFNRVCVSVQTRDQLTKTEHGWEHLQERSTSPPPPSSSHHWYGSQLNPANTFSFSLIHLKRLQFRPSVLFGSGSGPSRMDMPDTRPQEDILVDGFPTLPKKEFCLLLTKLTLPQGLDGSVSGPIQPKLLEGPPPAA